MDSLICQAYYNSALINVLKSLLIGRDRTKKSGNGSKRDDQDFSHVATSNMYHIQVPEYYVGKRYQKLFDNLTTRRQMIPLGLYRTTGVNLMAYKDLGDKSGRSRGLHSHHNKRDSNKPKTPVKYVVTNPEKDTRLE